MEPSLTLTHSFERFSLLSTLRGMDSLSVRVLITTVDKLRWGKDWLEPRKISFSAFLDGVRFGTELMDYHENEKPVGNVVEGGGKVSNNGTVDLSLVSSLRVLMELGDDRGAGALSVICCPMGSCD